MEREREGHTSGCLLHGLGARAPLARGLRRYRARVANRSSCTGFTLISTTYASEIHNVIMTCQLHGLHFT